MATLVHRYIDLPVYDREAVVFTQKSQFWRAAQKMPYFLRRLDIHNGGKLNSLEDILRIADEGFEQVAQGCGAVVVRRSYGLYPKKDSAIPILDDLPPDHILVAEVESIKAPGGADQPLEPTDEQKSEIRQSGEGYIAQHRVGDVCWGDYLGWNGLSQFTNGYTPTHGEALHLHDIDPITYKIR